MENQDELCSIFKFPYGIHPELGKFNKKWSTSSILPTQHHLIYFNYCLDYQRFHQFSKSRHVATKHQSHYRTSASKANAERWWNCNNTKCHKPHFEGRKIVEMWFESLQNTKKFEREHLKVHISVWHMIWNSIIKQVYMNTVRRKTSEVQLCRLSAQYNLSLISEIA